jgi:hypothetical protein
VRKRSWSRDEMEYPKRGKLSKCIKGMIILSIFQMSFFF